MIRNVNTATGLWKVIKEDGMIKVNSDIYKIVNIYKPDLTINNFIFTLPNYNSKNIISLNSGLYEKLRSSSYDYFIFSKNSLKLSTINNSLYSSANDEVTVFRSCIMKEIPYFFLKKHWKKYKIRVASVLRRQI